MRTDNLVLELRNCVCVLRRIINQAVQQDNGIFSEVVSDQASELHTALTIQIVERKIGQFFKRLNGSVQTHHTLPKIIVQSAIALGKLGPK